MSPDEEKRFFPLPDVTEYGFLESCFGGSCPDGFVERCRRFGEHLYETNRTFNLTAIPETGYWSKHVCDSLSVVFAEARLRTDAIAVCDVGCGAGFPSVILAVAFPQLRITAVDSKNKKVRFVNDAASLLGLSNLTAVHGRASELAGKEGFRGVCEIVTARAVADAPELLKECRGLLKPGGRLVVYRTRAQAAPELELLRSKRPMPRIRLTQDFELPNDVGGRLFLVLS